MSAFNLVSNYQPTGDQPTAIAQLVDGLKRGEREQTLLGVTGSGKTFTMANIKSDRLAASSPRTLLDGLVGAFIGSAHDAVSAAGNDGVAEFG